ncbi:hypothetical protein BDA99DRAFT_522269 [Phascolomyces articulosus]|uniref:Cyclase n=1 Tax=Phascolomyces articulosus TaxID=60185 RepID=A0AAD5K2D7_9FUNG|nr:hypothetical protein BDA99DRAFT_522269 [Phascolomyces articulosus]
MTDLPTFDQLPIKPEYPPHSAWGVWGEDDNLGTLNLLTEDVVTEAGKCIKKGKVFALNWELEKPNPPLFGRQQIQHNLHPHSAENVSFDDSYDNFNPQSSSQWDGLCHISHLPTATFYNGIKPEEVIGRKSDRLGIHHMARRGIAGRAVLLDYARWAARHRPEFNPLVRTEIPVEELKQVAEAQGVTFKKGDILLIRVGWISAYEKEGHRLHEMMDLKSPECAGVKACEDTFRWIWENHFSAVGCDNFPFEAFPPKWEESCHVQFLGGWGMPIGEMFFLDKLAEDSAQDGVYEYFFTSAPLNKYQGVASPPNAVCIK